MLSDQLISAVSEQLQGDLVGQVDGAIGLQQNLRVRSGFEELLEGLLRALGVADISRAGDIAKGSILGLVDGVRILHQSPVAIAIADPRRAGVAATRLPNPSPVLG